MNTHLSPAVTAKSVGLHIGDHLREWRQRRHLSQLDLATDAEISSRHLSFVETGRAAPSRDMVLRLAERLDVPLRERNVLLVAAGFAPAFSQRSLDDPALKANPQFKTFLKIFTNPNTETTPITIIGAANQELFQTFLQKWQSGHVTNLEDGLKGVDKQIEAQMANATAGQAP